MEKKTGGAQLQLLVEQLLRRHGAILSPSEYSRLMFHTFQRTKNPHDLTLAVYDAFTSHHSLDDADLPLLQHALHVLSIHSRYCHCIDVWNALTRRQLPIDASTLGIVLHACDQENDELAWHIFRRYQDAPANAILPSPSATPSSTQNKEPLAYSHEALAQDGAVVVSTPFNLLHYTHIISALNRTISAHYVPIVLAHMHYHRVRPDLYLYTRILAVLASKRLYREQMTVLREMWRVGVPADEKCYYLVLRCHADCGRWKDGLELIEELRARQLRINEFIYEAAVIACEKANKLEKAMEIVAEMHSRAVVMTFGCYASLVQLAKQAGEWEWVVHLYHSVKDRRRYREHSLSNDAVLLAAHRLSGRRAQGAFERSPIDSLRLSPQQLADHMVGFVGPVGFWLQVEEKVREMEMTGQTTLDAEVREKLALATTPLTPQRMGVIDGLVLHRQEEVTEAVAEPVLDPQQPSRRRVYRFSAPSQPVDHTLAALDLLLRAVYWKTALRLKGEEALSLEEKAWLERVQDVPTSYDGVELRCHTEPMASDANNDEEDARLPNEGQPSIGQFCADSVNGLWSYITRPFSPPSADSPASPTPQAEPTSPLPPLPAGSPLHTPYPLTPRPRPAELGGEGVDLGRELVQRAAQHLKQRYGMSIRPSVDGYFHTLTLTPRHLRTWLLQQSHAARAARDERQRRRRGANQQQPNETTPSRPADVA